MDYQMVGVEYQFDCDSPVMSGVVRYRVEALQTEIIFPSGTTKRFDNWDVKGCTQRYYRDEYVEREVTEADMVRESVTKARRGETTEHGIRQNEVRTFVACLAKKPLYEPLFVEPPMEEFAEVMAPSDMAEAVAAN